jgi:hypothetical protein
MAVETTKCSTDVEEKPAGQGGFFVSKELLVLTGGSDMQTNYPTIQYQLQDNNPQFTHQISPVNAHRAGFRHEAGR